MKISLKKRNKIIREL